MIMQTCMQIKTSNLFHVREAWQRPYIGEPKIAKILLYIDCLIWQRPPIVQPMVLFLFPEPHLSMHP